MNYHEANQLQREVVASLVAFIVELFRPFRKPKLSYEEWLTLLSVAYPRVFEAREESSRLGREFYDSERIKHVGSRHDAFLSNYDFERFVEDMEPARGVVVDPDANDEAIAQAALRAAKVVENGWRRTVIRAVQNDPRRPRWARVATGRETCGFCLMLVSRGAIYSSARSAGLNVDDKRAGDLFAQIERAHSEDSRSAQRAMDRLMVRWHVGCDCRVVPVYDLKNWPGRDAYIKAEELWKQVTKGYTGRDAINAFRRAVENGDLGIQEIAAAAA